MLRVSLGCLVTAILLFQAVNVSAQSERPSASEIFGDVPSAEEISGARLSVSRFHHTVLVDNLNYHIDEMNANAWTWGWWWIISGGLSAVTGIGMIIAGAAIGSDPLQMDTSQILYGIGGLLLLVGLPTLAVGIPQIVLRLAVINRYSDQVRNLESRRPDEQFIREKEGRGGLEPDGSPPLPEPDDVMEDEPEVDESDSNEMMDEDEATAAASYPPMLLDLTPYATQLSLGMALTLRF